MQPAIDRPSATGLRERGEDHAHAAEECRPARRRCRRSRRPSSWVCQRCPIRTAFSAKSTMASSPVGRTATPLARLSDAGSAPSDVDPGLLATEARARRCCGRDGGRRSPAPLWRAGFEQFVDVASPHGVASLPELIHYAEVTSSFDDGVEIRFKERIPFQVSPSIALRSCAHTRARRSALAGDEGEAELGAGAGVVQVAGGAVRVHTDAADLVDAVASGGSDSAHPFRATRDAGAVRRDIGTASPLTGDADAGPVPVRACVARVVDARAAVGARVGIVTPHGSTGSAGPFVRHRYPGRLGEAVHRIRVAVAAAHGQVLRGAGEWHWRAEARAAAARGEAIDDLRVARAATVVLRRAGPGRGHTCADVVDADAVRCGLARVRIGPAVASADFATTAGATDRGATQKAGDAGARSGSGAAVLLAIERRGTVSVRGARTAVRRRSTSVSPPPMA